MERRAHRVRSAVHGSAHAAIGIARGHHERSEVERLFRHCLRFQLGGALGAPPFVIQRRVPGGLRRVRRVDERHTLRRMGRRRPDQHGLDHAFARQAGRRFQNARVGPFGKHNGFITPASSRHEPVHEESC